jgi:zinc transporter
MSSESTFFVCAYLLDGEGGGTPMDRVAVDAWTPADGLLWVHTDVLNPNDREWLHELEDVDETARDALLFAESRPRVVYAERGILLVLRGINMNEGQDPDDMVSIRLWIEETRIVSSRRRLLQSVRDIRESIEQRRGPSTSGELVAMLIERLTDRIGRAVDGVGDTLDEVEEGIAEAATSVSGAMVRSLRRQTASYRRYLAPQREALERLYRQPPAFFSGNDVNEIREQSDRVLRALEELDLARERAMVLAEELLGRLAQEQNARMYVLSVVAAIFLPLTFVTGLLGMNVAGLPGTESPLGFLVSLLVMLGLGFGVAAFFRFKGWL